MTPREILLAEAAKRILIIDGAFGTEIQNWKLAEADYAGSLGLTKDQKGNNDILALTKPEVPESIHRVLCQPDQSGRLRCRASGARDQPCFGPARPPGCR
jgi:hypothetical protein